MATRREKGRAKSCLVMRFVVLSSVSCASFLLVSSLGFSEARRTNSGETHSREAGSPPAWCASILGGDSSQSDSIAIQTAVMHANARFFAPAASYAQFEQGLSAALAAAPVANGPNLDTYASFIDSACVVSKEPSVLSPAKVTMVDRVAMIHPGFGGIAVPEEAWAAVIDLRNLPNAETLKPILAELLAQTSAKPVKRGNRSYRVHNGMTDEFFSNSNVYKNSIQREELPPFAARGNVDLPLAIIVPQKMSPAAADFAISLRLARRAWLIGDDVFSGVAESSWYPVGSSGLAFRVSTRGVDETPWPDRIRADYRLQEIELLKRRMRKEGSPPEITDWIAKRSPILSQTPFGTVIQPTAPKGDLRAALVSTYGAVRLFDPDYSRYQRDIDARFLEVIAQVEYLDVSSRTVSRNLLRRFGNALVDGHTFVTDKIGNKELVGSFPVDIEDVEGVPVVRRSWVQGIAAGDTLVSINGRSMAGWYAEEYSRVSAETEGYRFHLASGELQAVSGALTVEIRTPEGVSKVVNTAPYPFEVLREFRWKPRWDRPSGRLKDLNAPDILYLNMSAEKDWWQSDAVIQFREAAKSAKGIVVDMRGYPSVNHYEVAQSLICEPFRSPQFLIPVVRHGVETQVRLEQSTLDPFPANERFCGPLVLLVGKHSVSAAENFATLLADARRVLVVGERSAGTNGNVTGISLAGGFTFSLTGMEVRHADGSPFHGIGIVPGIEVKETVADLAQGADPQLLRAVSELNRR